MRGFASFSRLLLGVVLLVALAGCAEKDPIVGAWEGKSMFGADLVLTFDGKGEITITFVREGVVNRGTYTLDRTTTPISFDYQLEGRGKIQTILEFVDENTFAFEEQGSSSDPRPTAFGRHRLVFRRKG